MRAGEKALPLIEMRNSGDCAAAREDVPTAAPSIDALLVHREEVFRVCLGFSRDYTEAEDLTQEAYLKACRSLGGLKNPLQAREWLLRIAKNTCLDAVKKERFRRILLRRWAAESGRAGSREMPEDADRGLGRLKSAVRRLPRKLKEVFVLREYGHLTYDELAATLGLRKGTVMSRLHRARSRVTAALQEKTDDRPRK